MGLSIILSMAASPPPRRRERTPPRHRDRESRGRGCSRCGRDTHNAANCYAKKDIDERWIDDDSDDDDDSEDDDDDGLHDVRISLYDVSSFAILNFNCY